MSHLDVATASNTSPHPLITQTLVETKKFFCPFLERGYCREASRCNFSHNHYGSIKIPTDYCHFYLANKCLYDHDCKFRHNEPEPGSSHTTPEASPSSSSSSSLASYLSSTSILKEDYHPSSSRSHSLVYGHHQAISDELTQEVIGQAHDQGEYLPECLPRTSNNNSNIETHKNAKLCPYSSESGDCPFPPSQCSYLHGLDCDLCGRACLHPYDLEQQRKHRDDCLKEHEREMELSFAVQRSKDKVCGICMDTVVEKKPITSSRFGILEKCNHIFCLDCIRKWRGTKQFETRTIRACPECRVSSDFVVPSKYWVEDQDDKEKLIHDYKAALRLKPCKYFNEGKGDCPFAGSCFYKHAYPDGRIAKLETPKSRKRLHGTRGPSSTTANYILWSILTSTDDDEWSIDELESLYLDPDFGTEDEDDDEDDIGDDNDDDDDDVGVEYEIEVEEELAGFHIV